MTPLLESVTIAQAALLAAIGEALLTLYYVIVFIPLAGSSLSFSYLPPIILGSVVPSAIWAVYLFVLYRDRSGFPSLISLHAATWITLALGVGLQVFDLIRVETVMISWTLAGNAHRIVNWLLPIGWVLLLLSLVFRPDHLWTRRVAMAMLILSAPSALEEAYNGTWNNRGMLFWNDYPLEALWRVVTIPAIRIFYVLSQILFLWTIWRNPQRRGPIETLSAHLAP